MSSRQGRTFAPALALSSRSVRLDSETVVNRTSQSLFASKVALRRLDRDVPQEESNLIQARDLTGHRWLPRPASR